MSTWKQRADNSISHGALTNSKRTDAFPEGYPTHLLGAARCFVTDTDDKKYIDYICSLGAVLLGHTDYDAKYFRAPLLPLSSTDEVIFAETVKAKLPYIERIRITKTGSEGCLAAIRIARAYTKRLPILSSGYHGWGDAFTSLSAPSSGVPALQWISSLIDDEIPYLGDVAAVIIEPIELTVNKARVEWLQELVKQASKAGCLVIFDETITALRFPKLTVAKTYGITPDLSVFGKALGGGFPLSVVGGRRAVMECDYFISGTYYGERSSLKIATHILNKVSTEKISERLWQNGEEFLIKFNRIAPELVKIVGYPTRGVFTGTPINRAIFMQQAVKSGILFGQSWFFMDGHEVFTDETISVCQSILLRMQKGELKLSGEVPSTVFWKKELKC